jgi:SPP1 gp7 family putative phage head morphogenesis protein
MKTWEEFFDRRPLMKADYDPLSHEEKLTAFSYAGAASIEQIRHVFRELGESIMAGDSFRDFKEKIEGGEISLDIEGYHLENIFRTNNLTAKNRGHYVRQERTKSAFPYLRYETAKDDRVRPNHRALDGLAVKFGSEEADKIYPPNGYNCRCIFVPITEDEYEAVKRPAAEVAKTINSNLPDPPDFIGPPFVGKGPGDLAMPDIGERYRRDGRVYGDKDFKRAFEELEKGIEVEKNLEIVAGGVNESLLANTEEFLETEGKKGTEEFKKKEKAAKKAGKSTVKLPTVDEITVGTRLKLEDFIEETRQLEINRRLDGLLDSGRVKLPEGKTLKGLSDGEKEKLLDDYTGKVAKDIWDKCNEMLVYEEDFGRVLGLKTIFKDLENLDLYYLGTRYQNDSISKEKVVKEIVDSLHAMSNLTENERLLLTIYTTEKHAEINKMILNESTDKALSEYLERLDDMHKSLKNMGILKTKDVYRGLSSTQNIIDVVDNESIYKKMGEYAKEKKNMDVKMRLVSSTSIKKDIAVNFGNMETFNNSLLLQINTSEGIPVTTVSAYEEEFEEIMLPGTSFRINKIVKTEYGDFVATGKTLKRGKAKKPNAVFGRELF